MSVEIFRSAEWSLGFLIFANFRKYITTELIAFHVFHVLTSFTSANGSVNAFLDVPCMSGENCTSITGEVTCDTLIGKCICAEGNVRMQLHYHCVPYAGIGEDCQDNKQCRHTDPRAFCSMYKRCRCPSSYEVSENNGSSLCSKSRHVESELVHIFGGLDTVHIVLGCLTGGLALLACFAGIAQLVRKKWSGPRCSNDADAQFSPDLGFSTPSAPSQGHPYTDSQFTMTPPSGGDFSMLDGNSTAPPTPGTLGDDDYIVTPPPTYEEALQQSSRAKAGSSITV